MGCDIWCFFDHDMHNLSACEFVTELEKRTGKKVYFTGFDESPYANNKSPKNGIEFFCFNKDYESLFCNPNDGFDIIFRENDKPMGFEFSFNRYSISYYGEKEGIDLTESARWFPFLRLFYEEKDEKFIKEITEKIERIKKIVLPIFHSKKIILCNDQMDGQLFGCKLFENASVEEALDYATKELNMKVFPLNSTYDYDGENDIVVLEEFGKTP